MKAFYIIRPGGTQDGPLDETFIKEQFDAGIYEDNTVVWTTGMPDWVLITSVFPKKEPSTPTSVLPAMPPMAPPPPPPPPVEEATPAPPPPEEIGSILISEGEQQRGPFKMSEIRRMYEQGEISDKAAYWIPGMTEWKSISELLNLKTFVNPLNAFNKTLPKLQGFSLSRFFSLVFKRHTRDEILDIFCCGTSKTTPNLLSIDTSWPTPWIFARLFVICLLLYFGFSWGYREFENTKFIPGLIFTGTFGVPFCIFILFFELNIRRDVSLYDAIKGLIVGGLLSIILASVFFSHTEAFHRALGAPWAGPVEETGKLLIAILIASGLRNGRILTGLLVGASVGAGFAAFESAGYVYEDYSSLSEVIIILLQDILRGGNPQEAEDFLQYYQAQWDPESTLRLRALLAPIAHVLWTAITAGAFWMVHDSRVKEGLCQAEDNAYDWATLVDKRFLRIALIPVLLHMFNNCSLLQTPTIAFLISRGITGIFGWLIALRLVQKGLHQIREEQGRKVQEETATATASTPEKEGNSV